MSKGFLPKTPYERESLLKSFLLFFLTIEVLLALVFFLLYRNELINLKQSLFLEMKNYSYTFEGEKFRIDIVPLAEYGDRGFYELYEDAEGLFILVPVPVSEEDALKIFYPRESLSADLSGLRRKVVLLFLLSSLLALFISLMFSLYALNPLRRALKMIEEVTRDIIHDINTPLMSLMVNLKMLRSRYRDEELERAQLALKQLQRLRENLRPLTAKTELTLGDVNVRKILLEELEDLRKIYPDIRVETDLAEVTLRADESALRRIVGNVLSNAFKHNTEGGWVRVKLSRDLLRVENSSPPVRDPDRVFDRYYRESQRGLGLGLSIVKKLCEELGWRVRAHYADGTFSLEISFR